MWADKLIILWIMMKAGMGTRCPGRWLYLSQQGRTDRYKRLYLFAAPVVLVILLLQDSFLSQIKSRKVSSFCLASNKFLMLLVTSLTFRHLPALMIPSSASDSFIQKQSCIRKSLFYRLPHVPTVFQKTFLICSLSLIRSSLSGSNLACRRSIHRPQPISGVAILCLHMIRQFWHFTKGTLKSLPTLFSDFQAKVRMTCWQLLIILPTSPFGA